MNIKKPLVAVAGTAVLGVAGLTALPALASAAPAPAVAVAAAHAPAYGVWPSQVKGRPTALKAGSARGFYLWHSSDGWRLEVTHPGASHVVFAGTITTDGTLAYQRVGDEPHDVTRLGPRHHVLSFAFNNYGHLDGVHFTTNRATKLTFNFTIDGKEAGTASVRIGAKGLRPDRVPFTVDRTSIH